MATENVIDLTRLSETEWELVDTPAPERETLGELLARLAQQVQQPNGYPIGLFVPLYQAIGERLKADATLRIARLENNN